MRIASFFILSICAVISYGQLTIKPIIKPEKNQRGRVSTTQTINRATLPFWDDFSITQDSPDSIRVWGNDTTTQWNYDLSKDVFVNATLSINPPSYGVATFDGLDVNGAFHGGDKGLGDQLVSDTIDLQGKVNVILSFYWQAAGNVEIPDEGDSLVLQFYTPNDTLTPWKTVWNVDGDELAPDQDTIFTQEVIQVSSQFLTQKFQFRFQSYGDLDGPFDAWHIDWIYLNDNRENDDFFYEDVSINSDASLLFSPYRSIPINQYQQQDIDPLFTATSMNLNPEPDRVGPSTFYNLKITEKRMDQEVAIDSAFNPDLRTFFNPDPFKITLVNFLNFGAQNLVSLLGSDSVIIETEISMDTTDFRFLDGTQINLRVNDTVRTQNLLSNYYAYDDGTAEYAVGTNINGGQVAVEFWLEQSDTLTHVDIHFPNIDPPSANSALQLQIFKNLDAEPIRSQSINVINGSKINQFARYKLASPLILSDTFYIGYQQSKNEYIGVGFDRSNPAASEYIYENKTGQWEQNTRLIGALMIRPVFERIDSLVLGNEKKLVAKVYPNPTNGVLHIEGTYHSISLRDFSGRTILHQTKVSSHDLSSLKSGLYLLTIHRKEGDQTLKIIKQ
ncbi:T9SS type A sorting domain-containing protein [Ekhidna sp.]|uniref:T9SS type A sorting domain-containing protein n=1 Tax=Ekhidna sp. TaxID=2608089 RepID=UPI003BAC4FB5